MTPVRSDTALLHGSPATENAPYPRWISSGPFENWAAKPGHPIERTNANIGFSFLVREVARL
jgi:hypothetical protein